MAYTAPANMAGAPVRSADVDAGAHHAYQLLHFGFTVLPIIVGIDKFTQWLADWDKYLAPVIPRTLGMAPHAFMMMAGVIEIVAGLIVAFWPKAGAAIVSLWLIGIIGNLVLNPNHYWDVAVRDFGLFLGAMALGSLSGWAQRRAMQP